MPREFKMALNGSSHANTVPENAKEMSLKHVPWRNMTLLHKPCPSSSVWKVIVPTGLDQDKNAPKSTDWTGPRSKNAQQVKKVTVLSMTLLSKLKPWFPLTPMFLGWLSMESILKATRMQSLTIWLNSFALFTQDLKELQPVIDTSIVSNNYTFITKVFCKYCKKKV